MAGALLWRQRFIDNSSAMIGDHLDLDSVYPDKIARLVEMSGPKAAIGVLIRSAEHLSDRQRRGVSESR